MVLFSKLRIDKMRKIFIVIENAYSYAGTEKVCDFMSSALGENYEVVILSLKGDGRTFYPYSKAHSIISFCNARYPLVDAVKTIISENYDTTVFVVSMGRLSVFFSFLYRFYSLFISGFNRKLRRKIISCEHVSLDSFSRHIKFLKYVSLKSYSNVIVLTEKDHVKLNSWGIKSEVIPNSLIYQNYKRVECRKVALSVGRLEYQKGFDILLRVWSEFIKKNSEWKLLIAGDGSLKQELLFLAKTLNIEDSVTFLGLVDKMDDCYKESDIYLMTSRYEGLPLVLLEAKSWGLPTIAFDCPTGPAEIISDCNDGFLIPDFNEELYLEKLNTLANDDKLREYLSDNTEMTSKKFDAELIKRKWNSLV